MVSKMSEGQQALVTSNIGLVYYVARRYRYRAEALGIEFDDLVATGVLALCKAARVYVPERGKFSTLAVLHIKNEMLHLLQKARRRPRTVPIVVPWEHDESDDGHNESVWLRCEVDLSDVEWRDFVRRLTEREQTLLALALAGYTQEEIARRLGISQPHVSRLLKRVERRWNLQSASG